MPSKQKNAAPLSEDESLEPTATNKQTHKEIPPSLNVQMEI